VWRLNPKSALHFRRWGNEWVVFDVASGQTHEMDSISAVMLMHCEKGWIPLHDIVSGVTTDLELPSNETLVERVLSLLAQFSNLELIEKDIA